MIDTSGRKIVVDVWLEECGEKGMIEWRKKKIRVQKKRKRRRKNDVERCMKHQKMES